MSGDGGREVASGRLRVDRKRALEKMERHQLEDPFRYGVELVAAAVAAGATEVHVQCDADDLHVAWTGDLPSRDELDGLFDHLYARSVDAHERMLQHLAVGVLAAHGLKPRRIRLERAAVGEEPALRLDVTDPADTRSTPLTDAAPAGVRVHVRESLGAAVLRDMVDMVFGKLPVEGRHVASAFRWSPVPIVVNGKALARPPAPTLAVASRAQDVSDALWLVPGGDGVVELTRDGVAVGRVALPVVGTAPAWSVTGVYAADRLNLNASRSEVVRDQTFDAVRRELELARAALLRDGWPEPDGDAPYPAEVLPAARAAAIELGSAAIGRIGALPLLEDVAGRRWSIGEVRALSFTPGFLTTAVDGAVGTPAEPLFGPSEVGLLRAVAPGAVDMTAVEQQRAAGARRRRAAAPISPWTEAPGERRFEFGDAKGSVRLAGPGDGGVGHARLHIGVGGRRVEERRLRLPAGEVVAVVDDPGLSVDLAFERVAADPRWRALEERIVREAEALIADALGALDFGPAGAIALLTAWIEAKLGVRTLKEFALTLRPATRAAAIFEYASGQRVSLDALLGRTTRWFVSGGADVPPSLHGDVLRVPPLLATRWRGWFGAPGADVLDAAIERARRLDAPRQPARLFRAGLGPAIPVKTEKLSGEIAHDPSLSVPAVRVLRSGVEVATLHPPLCFGAVAGVVDWPELAVNEAHSRPAGQDAATVLAAELDDAADQLALSVWQRTPVDLLRPLSASLASWLTARGPRRWREPHLAGVIGVDAAGERLTLGALLQLVEGKEKVMLLSAPPPAGLDIGPSIVVGAPARTMAEAAFPGRFADGDGAVRVAGDAFRALLQRGPPPAPPTALARCEVSLGEGVSLELRLPADPSQAGALVVVVAWRERLLHTHSGSTGLWGLLSGPGIAPDRRFSTVRDPGLLQRAEREAARRLDDLLEEVVARYDEDDAVATNVILAVRARMRRTSGDAAKLLNRIDALPLLTRIDGERVSVEAVAAAADAREPVGQVAGHVPAGAATQPWIVVGEHAGAAVAARLGKQVPDLTREVQRLRSGQDRLARAPRRPLTVDGATVARAPIDADGLRGEVALLADGPDGLTVVPTVAGVRLQAVSAPFPGPAAAVIEGDPIRPDADGVWAVPGRALDVAIAAVRRAAAALAQASLASPTPAVRPWLHRFALAGDPAAAAADLFPLVDGSMTSALALRSRRGGVGVVRRRGARLPAEPQPVVDEDGSVARVLIAAGLVVHPLDDVLARAGARMPAPIVPKPSVVLAAPRMGELGLNVERPGVEVRVGGERGVVVQVWRDAALLPVSGWVSDPAVTPKPDWTDLHPDAAAAALRAAVREASRELVIRLLAAPLPFPADTARLLRYALRALAPSPSDVRQREDTLLAALCEAPLFVDGEGETGSLSTLRSGGVVLAIDSEMCARPAPGRPRFWRLDEVDRAWLSRSYTVRDAASEAAIQDASWARRTAPPWPKPTPPPDAEAISGAGVVGAVWAGDGGVQVLSDGRALQVLETAGLTGWIDGPLETDDGFREAKVPPSIRSALDKRVSALKGKKRQTKAAPVRRRPEVRSALDLAVRWAPNAGQRVKARMLGWDDNPPQWLGPAAIAGEVGVALTAWAALADHPEVDEPAVTLALLRALSEERGTA